MLLLSGRIGGAMEVGSAPAVGAHVLLLSGWVGGAREVGISPSRRRASAVLLSSWAGGGFGVRVSPSRQRALRFSFRRVGDELATGVLAPAISAHGVLLPCGSPVSTGSSGSG